MRTSKAELQWHGTTLLQRTVGVLGDVCGEVLVVSARGQELTVTAAAVVRDQHPGLGPLQGLADGLHAAAERGHQAAFVSATDMPLLQSAFVLRILDALTADVDLVLPVDDEREHPLAAAYATALAPVVSGLVARGERRLRALAQHCRVRRLSRAELLTDAAPAAADPRLDSLVNVNTPEELARLRGRTGQ